MKISNKEREEERKREREKKREPEIEISSSVNRKAVFFRLQPSRGKMRKDFSSLGGRERETEGERYGARRKEGRKGGEGE